MKNPKTVKRGFLMLAAMVLVFSPVVLQKSFIASSLPLDHITARTQLVGPNVAVTNISLEKTVVGQGFPMRINVTVTNDGNTTESFNVTTYHSGTTRQITLSGSASSGWNGTSPGPPITVNLGDTINVTLISADSFSHLFFVDYNDNLSPDGGEPASSVFSTTTTYTFIANVSGTFNYRCAFHPSIMHGNFTVNATPSTTSIGSQTVSPPLATGQTTVLTFVWNTTGTSFGNYTMSAVADTVPGEVNTTDNTLIAIESIHVGVPGDMSGPTQGVYDGTCNLRDVAYMILLFNTKPTSQNWNPNADVTDDGVTNMRDIATAIFYFNQHE